MLAPILIAIFFVIISYSYMGLAIEYLNSNQLLVGILMISLTIIFLVGIVGYFYKHKYLLFLSLLLICAQTIYYIGSLIWIIIIAPLDLGYSFILFLLSGFTGFFIHASIIIYTWDLYGKAKNQSTASFNWKKITR